MAIWLSMGLTAETTVLILAGMAWFFSMGYTLAESVAAAVLLLFIAISLMHQIGFFTASVLPGLVLEAGFLSIMGWLLFSRRDCLRRIVKATAGLMREERIAGWTLMATGMGLALWTVAGWKASTVPVPPGRLYAPMLGGVFSAAVQRGLPPLNAAALLFHTARFNLAPGAAGFGLLGYFSIGCSTYALARRYAWPAMALTVTLLVMSMPRMAALALHPNEELFSTAAVAFSLVLLYRLLEQHRVRDLRFFLLCLPFSIDAEPLSLALAAVLTLLLVVVMIRRHGWLAWRELMLATPLVSLLVLIPALVLAQAPVFVLNLVEGRSLFGAPVAGDAAGIAGAAANLIRYLMISIDPTEPMRRLAQWAVGLDLQALVMAVYRVTVVPLFSHAGEAWPFAPAFSGCGTAGFGPVALSDSSLPACRACSPPST